LYAAKELRRYSAVRQQPAPPIVHEMVDVRGTQGFAPLWAFVEGFEGDTSPRKPKKSKASKAVVYPRKLIYKGDVAIN
jgi:hypothetical protein